MLGSGEGPHIEKIAMEGAAHMALVFGAVLVWRAPQRNQGVLMLMIFLNGITPAFDALTSNRPYREKISVEEALQYLNEQSGILFDPNIVPVFEQLIMKDETGLVFSE